MMNASTNGHLELDTEYGEEEEEVAKSCIEKRSSN